MGIVIQGNFRPQQEEFELDDVATEAWLAAFMDGDLLILDRLEAMFGKYIRDDVRED